MNNPPTSKAERAAQEANCYTLESQRGFAAGTRFSDEEKDKLIVDLQMVIATRDEEIERLTSKLIEIKDLCEMELCKHNG